MVCSARYVREKRGYDLSNGGKIRLRDANGNPTVITLASCESNQLAPLAEGSQHISFGFFGGLLGLELGLDLLGVFVHDS